MGALIARSPCNKDDLPITSPTVRFGHVSYQRAYDGRFAANAQRLWLVNARHFSDRRFLFRFYTIRQCIRHFPFLGKTLSNSGDFLVDIMAVEVGSGFTGYQSVPEVRLHRTTVAFGRVAQATAARGEHDQPVAGGDVLKPLAA